MTKRRNKVNISFIIFGISMMALSMVHFLVFWVYVNIDTIKLTFTEYNPINGSFFWNNFENYTKYLKYLFVNDGSNQHIETLNTFVNTFKAVIINLIIFPIALITAYAFYKKIYLEKFFRIIFYLPTIIIITVQVTAFRSMFNTEFGGPYAKFFSLFGYSPIWLSSDPNNNTIWPLIYAFSIISGLGTNVILLNSAMLRIPREVTEAARLDGCSFYKELTSIVIPLIMPTITTWMTAILTSVFSFIMQPMLISNNQAGSNGKYLTIPWLIFNNVSGTNGVNYTSFPYIATIGIVLSVFVMPFVLFMRWLFNRITPDVSF